MRCDLSGIPVCPAQTAIRWAKHVLHSISIWIAVSLKPSAIFCLRGCVSLDSNPQPLCFVFQPNFSAYNDVKIFSVITVRSSAYQLELVTGARLFPFLRFYPSFMTSSAYQLRISPFISIRNHFLLCD
jgi:hypothetical protein